MAGEGGGVSDDGGGVLRYLLLTLSATLEFPEDSRAATSNDQLASSVTFSHNCSQNTNPTI